MTDEQNERLKQIHRWRMLHTSANSDPYADLSRAFSEIDFLLSLLDSQASEGDLIPRKEVVARIERQIRLWNNDTVTMACADMLADVRQLPTSDPATATRSRCVQRLRGLADQYQAAAKDSADKRAFAANVLRDAALAMESLPLDQVEQEKPR